jgi:hypothetical protein
MAEKYGPTVPLGKMQHMMIAETLEVDQATIDKVMAMKYKSISFCVRGVTGYFVVAPDFVKKRTDRIFVSIRGTQTPCGHVQCKKAMNMEHEDLSWLDKQLAEAGDVCVICIRFPVGVQITLTTKPHSEMPPERLRVLEFSVNEEKK